VVYVVAIEHTHPRVLTMWCMTWRAPVHYVWPWATASIFNAVSAIDSCAREEPGRAKCSKIQSAEMGEEATSGGFWKNGFGSK